MNEDQLLQAIQKTIKDEVRPLKENLEVIKNKVDKLELFQSTSSGQIRFIREQQSVINEKLDTLESVKTDLSLVYEDLKKLNEIKEIIEDRLYPSVMAIELDIKAYGDMYELNNDNAKKLDHRLKVVESKSNIKPDPEFLLSEAA